MRDPLTGLIDRATLLEVMDTELTRSTQRNRPFGVVLFDIDRFKLINYGFGDGYGDIVLKEVARAAEQKLRAPNFIGRWGGQQFLCILPDTDCKTTDAFAEEMRKLLESLTLSIESRLTHITASFGVACFPEDGNVLRRLLAAAEAALYQAKESGRNRVVHAGNIQQQVFGMGTLLDSALRENRVVPAYQAIVDLQTGRVVAEEALARIMTTEGEIVQAEDFIEVARQLQLTYKIDHTIMTSTFARLVRTISDKPPITHFVNISGNLLRHPKVVQDLLESAQKHCNACGNRVGPIKPVVIEITERELLGDIKMARELIAPFVDFGLRLALDDFGSGYSSFQYLADLPFSFLKIEGSLIRRIHEPKVRSIVEGIQKTAADLGLISLAECVEDQKTADLLRHLGINWAQGYHFERPLVPAMFRVAQPREINSRY